MDCSICYFSYPAPEDFFELTCCKNNLICHHCIKLLYTPICPFCRTSISNYPGSPLLSISAPITNNYWFNYQINPLDDTYVDSRILRRRMKRLRKLQERERDRQNNIIYSQTIKESKNHYKKEIERIISSDYDSYKYNDIIFNME